LEQHTGEKSSDNGSIIGQETGHRDTTESSLKREESEKKSTSGLNRSNYDALISSCKSG
jgi:hypothetical protein